MTGIQTHQHDRLTAILKDVQPVDRARLLNAIESAYDHAKLGEGERAKLKWDLWTSERVKKLPQWLRLDPETKKAAARYLDRILFEATGCKGATHNVNAVYKGIDRSNDPVMQPVKIML